MTLTLLIIYFTGAALMRKGLIAIDTDDNDRGLLIVLWPIASAVGLLLTLIGALVYTGTLLHDILGESNDTKTS